MTTLNDALIERLAEEHGSDIDAFARAIEAAVVAAQPRPPICSIPPGWKVISKGDMFGTIVVTSPKGNIAVTTVNDSNPGNVLRELVLALAVTPPAQIDAVVAAQAEPVEPPDLPTHWTKVTDPDGVEVKVWRAFQMRDYARAYAAAQPQQDSCITLDLAQKIARDCGLQLGKPLPNSLLALTVAQPQQEDPWKTAIDEALIVGWLEPIRDDETPAQALARLIAWEVEIALDPKVSSRAAALAGMAQPQQADPAHHCTCPSGDGSLRWPCPQHPPAQQQQATAYPASEYGVDQWWFKEMADLWCATAGSTITHDQKRAAKIAVHAVQALIAAQPQQATDADALRRDNDNLRTVMIAAAEEISSHWVAHCDAEGYGPVNLMHRLEEGIPSEYGYTAGAFAELKAAQADEIAASVAFERERCAVLCEMWNTSPGSSLAKEIRGGAEAGKSQAEPVADELGWLIEMRPSENLLWWDGGFDVSDDYPSKRLFARMVNDVNKAVRFSRREDAQCVLDAMLAVRPSPLFARARTLYSVQEHMWIAPTRPQQATAAPAEPVAFEHDIGADRYRVVKGSFWWHVRIGDGTANVGKFHTKMAAEDMALKLLTAFRDGAFMQSKAAQPQQAAAQAEPVAWRYEDSRGNYRYRGYAPGFDREYAILKPVALYLAAQPQQVTANPPTPFDAVARAMDKASLLAGAVARSDTTLADERAADLRRHLVQYMYPPAQPQQATDCALEAATGEPHVDGWPLWSGLPPAAPVAWLQPAMVDSHVVPGRFETCEPGDYAAFPVYRAAAPKGEAC